MADLWMTAAVSTNMSTLPTSLEPTPFPRSEQLSSPEADSPSMSPTLLLSPYSSTSSSEYSCTSDNTKSLNQRQSQLHEGDEQFQQRQMQQRREHTKHEKQVHRQQTQQHEQEQREELVLVNTRDDMVTTKLNRDGDGSTEEGGKSKRIHACWITSTPTVHLTTFCSSGATQDQAQEQDGHASLLHHHSQHYQFDHAERQCETGDAMWQSMTESVSHEAEKAAEEGESKSESAHGVHCSIISSYIFDVSAATTPLSSSPPRSCSSTPPMPSADTDYSERSETNGPKVLDPSIRFEIVERLGYG
jgi:hypothetical protein